MRELGWSPSSINILGPNEPVGSARSFQVGRCDQGLRGLLGHRVCQGLRCHRIRQGDRLGRGDHPCQVRQVGLECRGFQRDRVDQVVQLVPFGLESSGHPLHEDQEDRSDHCRQVVQAVRVVLEVRESRRRRGDQVRQVVHLVPLVPLVQLGRAWPCIRTEVESAAICPPWPHLCQEHPCLHPCLGFHRDHQFLVLQRDLVDRVGRYSMRRLRCGLAWRHA